MGKVNVEAGLILESHDEAMGESLGAVFRAHVGSPFKINNCFDLALERSEFGFELFDLFGGGFLFELEADDVTERCGHFFFGSFLFFVMISKRKKGDEGEDGNKECSHGGSVWLDRLTHEQKGRDFDGLV